MAIDSDQPRTEPGSRETAGSVSYLDQALWQQLSDARDAAQFAAAWLALQCAMVSGALRGTVVLRQGEAYRPVAFWPDADAGSADLEAACENALRERKGVVRRGSDGATCLAYPLAVEDRIEAIAAIELSDRSEVQLRSIMRQLQWGSSWFEVHRRRIAPTELAEQKDRLALVLQFVITCLDYPLFTSAVTAVATELATQLDCERVSIGFANKHRMEVRAISHSANFDRKANLVRQIGLAMDESKDQLNTITCPRDEKSRYLIKSAHEKVLVEGGAGSICTVLMTQDEEVVGALTFEHRDAAHFSASLIEFCKQIALVVGPILELKRRDERSLLGKTVDSLRAFGGRLFGAQYLLLKTAVATLALLVVIFTLVTAEYRVSADATVEGIVQRHISAPLDGYVAAAYVRAGDVVKQGDRLFSLDDKDIQLEKLRWNSQRLQVEQKYRNALASHDSAEASIQKAALDQADVQIRLIESQLSRINAVAPFDGIIVSGDLSQQLGAPVRKGDTLLKLAPLNGYRLILEVDERDIATVAVGQNGLLSLSSLPEETLGFVVEKVTPESSADEGRNTFRVEAKLESQSEKLRPGMQGTGKIEIGQRRVIWIWTHDFFDWLRLQLWNWWL